MPGQIPKSFIDELLSRVDIVDVIEVRIPLKKAGRELTACCPFHNEKTPSFTVSPAKQFYHCFGCGAHGTAIGFLMEYEHLEFVEAIESLASQQGMPIPKGKSSPTGTGHNNHDQWYALLAQSQRFYQQQLGKHSTALKYLKNRQLSRTIIDEYALGYAPPHGNNLIGQFDHHQSNALLQTGMLAQNDNNKTYERFRGRIMFPIRDRRGRTCGFGGRIIDTSSAAKYLNSPETAIFHKSQILYGLHEALKATRQLDSLYVVEGYMDVIALAQHGIRNVVATLGTAINSKHLTQLFKFAHEIIFCLDGDQAGRQAAWRALENTLPKMREGYIVRFLLLPEGQDPDSTIRQQGKAAFEKITHTAPTLAEYFFDHLQATINMDTPDGRSRLISQAKPLLQLLPGGIFYEIMFNELAKRTGLPVEKLLEKNPDQPPGVTVSLTSKKNTLVRHLIALLLQSPALAQQVSDTKSLSGIQLPGVNLLVDLLVFLHQHPAAHTGVVLEHWSQQPQGVYLFELAKKSTSLTDEQLAAEFTTTLDRLKHYKASNPKQIAAKLARGETLSDEEKTLLRQAAHPQKA